MLNPVTLPRRQARNYLDTGSAGRSGPVRLVVLHDAETSETDTSAEGTAAYFATSPTAGSTQVCVDNNSGVRCVDDADVCHGAPGVNHDGLHIEQAGVARQTRAQWLDPYSRATIRNAAQVAAHWCIAHGLPPVHLSDAQLKAGAKGVIDHAQASRVYKRSTHTDCGPNYPWDLFVTELEAAYAQLVGPSFAVAVIAETDVDEGMALVLGSRFLWKVLRYPHTGVTVGHALLVGRAARLAGWYPKADVLSGPDRMATAQAVAAKIEKGVREP